MAAGLETVEINPASRPAALTIKAVPVHAVDPGALFPVHQGSHSPSAQVVNGQFNPQRPLIFRDPVADRGRGVERVGPVLAQLELPGQTGSAGLPRAARGQGQRAAVFFPGAARALACRSSRLSPVTSAQATASESPGSIACGPEASSCDQSSSESEAAWLVPPKGS